MKSAHPIALDRALGLLNAILADRGQSSLTAVGETLGLPKATAHRLARALVKRGLVVSAERGRYLPGPSIMMLMGESEASNLLARVSAPYVRRLARRSGLVAHLGVLDGGMVTYLVKAGTNPAAHFTREGMQLEAYCSAIGKVLLAYLPAEDLEAYLFTGPFVKLTEHTIVDPDALRSHIRAVGDAGFALDDREVANDLRCVGVPVRDSNGRVCAALSVSASATQLTGGRLARAQDQLVSASIAIRWRLSGGLARPASEAPTTPAHIQTAHIA